MNEYELIKGFGDTITCDQCDWITGDWYSNHYHAICEVCYKSINEQTINDINKQQIEGVTQ